MFVSIDAPTREMKIAAPAAGIIQTETGKRPKVQFVTVRDLIEGPRLGLGVPLNTIAAAQAAKVKPKPARKPTPKEPQFMYPLVGGKTGKTEQQSEIEFSEVNETLMLEAAEDGMPFQHADSPATRKRPRKRQPAA